MATNDMQQIHVLSLHGGYMAGYIVARAHDDVIATPMTSWMMVATWCDYNTMSLRVATW